MRFPNNATSLSELLQGQTCQSTIPIPWNDLGDKSLKTLKGEYLTPSLRWLDHFKLLVIATDSRRTILRNIPLLIIGAQFVKRTDSDQVHTSRIDFCYAEFVVSRSEPLKYYGLKSLHPSILCILVVII